MAVIAFHRITPEKKRACKTRDSGLCPGLSSCTCVSFLVFGPPRGLYHVLGQVVAKEHPGLSAAFETSGESKVTSK